MTMTRILNWDASKLEGSELPGRRLAYRSKKALMLSLLEEVLSCLEITRRKGFAVKEFMYKENLVDSSTRDVREIKETVVAEALRAKGKGRWVDGQHLKATAYVGEAGKIARRVRFGLRADSGLGSVDDDDDDVYFWFQYALDFAMLETLDPSPKNDSSRGGAARAT
ncbi:hypothetical protein CPC08DRAFT_756390 [Agrocybe pediades]|nr:hypothetical protein CPC08DRAFT_756390 [Agrocybe pediades]